MTIQRPIEPGCLALVLSGDEDGGKVVQVIRRVIELPKPVARNFLGMLIRLSPSDTWWEVDSLIMLYSSTWYAKFPYCPEKYLLRIDPDPEDFKHELEEDTKRGSPDGIILQARGGIPYPRI